MTVKAQIKCVALRFTHFFPFFAMVFFISFSTTCVAFSNIDGIQIYQKTLQPEHIQKLEDDIFRYRNASNLWDELREEFTLSHEEDNPAVQEKIEWYMNNQDYLLRSATRAAPYLYYILQQVKKRHLPGEVVLLPIIESGYNPFAVSSVGATGLWQMMPDTASGLGVKQTFWFDGRRDLIASTRGALNYLSYLQSFFGGNWLLAIAAYNTGEGNVLSAIRRNIREGYSTDFWSLPLAQQTRDYVPSLLALAAIISHPDQYPIYFPPVRNAPYLAQIDVGHSMSLNLAARLAGLSYDRIKSLNPGFKEIVLRKARGNNGPAQLVLPIENVQEFTENLANSPLKQETNWMHYRVKTGDTLPIIASKFNTTILAIRKLNHIGKNPIHHGNDLLIPLNIIDDTELADANNNKKRSKINTLEKQDFNLMPILSRKKDSYHLKPGDTIYMVRLHDTLARISTHFHVNGQSILAANHVSKQQIRPGKQIIIPTHAENKFSNNRLLKPGDTLYMVRRGDTVEKIANRFHTTPAIIRLTNLVDNDSLNEGEQLIIPTHLQG